MYSLEHVTTFIRHYLIQLDQFHLDPNQNRTIFMLTTERLRGLTQAQLCSVDNMNPGGDGKSGGLS